MSSFFVSKYYNYVRNDEDHEPIQKCARTSEKSLESWQNLYSVIL